MDILERKQQGGDPLDELPEGHAVKWVHPEYDRLRLVADYSEPDRPAAWRLEGHADDAATYAVVEWTGPDAERKARLYLACYLEAGGFERPPADVAHFVPLAALELPTRYVSALLLSGTNNTPTWVARRRGLDRDTVYAHISRVRADRPGVFYGSDPDERVTLSCSRCGHEWPFGGFGVRLDDGAKLARDACPECRTPTDLPRRSVSEYDTLVSPDPAGET